MSQDIKDLIQKIQQEGIQVAEDKAREIEEKARQEAEAILRNAKTEAAKIIAEAKERIEKMQNSSLVSLQQAGRNLLLSLREEIDAMLEKLLASSVKQAFTPEELVKIINTLIKESVKEDKPGIVISVNKDDLHRLEKGILSELKDEAKKGITLKPLEDITGGFIISFDRGKSHFDFTDKALAEYLGQYLKPRLAEILKT